MGINTNAKQEFLHHISYVNAKVLCAQIQKGEDWGDDEDLEKGIFMLTTGYTNEDWIEFLSKLDFVYDSGYGSQEIFGTIWFEDGTWSERGEYDGSEWYEYHQCPEIPDSVRRLDKERDNKLNELL
jgi:hypothetical protein